MTSQIYHTDSIIFDLDGTLWDGVSCYVNGFNEYFKSNNIQRRLTESDLFDLMGMEEGQYLEIVLPEFPAEERTQIYRKIIALQNDFIKHTGGQLYQSVKAGLEQLSQRFQLYIISNCGENTIESFFYWSGLGHLFTDFMAFGENFKPKNINIKHLIEKHHLQAPVYVGDTDSDGAQARLAGIPFAYVSYGFGKTDQYDLKFDDFEELTTYFINL